MKNSYKTVNINEIKYVIKNENDLIQKFLLNNRQWNNNILHIIGQLIKRFNLKHFLNIGCHIGTVALPLSKYIEKVTAIEAYPMTFKHLEEHIKINGLSNSHECFSVFVTKCGEVKPQSTCTPSTISTYVSSVGLSSISTTPFFPT